MYIYICDMYLDKKCPYKGCAHCKTACKEKQFLAMKYLIHGASTGSPQLNKALDLLKAYDFVYIMRIDKNHSDKRNPYVEIKGYAVTGGSDVHMEFIMEFYYKKDQVVVSMCLEDDDEYK